jgi:hypothetical protein
MRSGNGRGAAVAATLAAAVLVAPASATAPRQALPNLVALPTLALYVGGPTSGSVSSPGNDVVLGCHPAEAVQDGARRCLRFQTVVANLGTGPLELHYRADQLAGARGVTQRVFAADGTYTDVPAGSYELDPTHAHFHYSEFAVAHLWRSDGAGRRLGKAPLRSGRKDGFCLVDVYQYRGSAPSRYTAPNGCYPTSASPSGEVSQVNGVSPGWVDVYDVDVPHQYLEITGVPDGYYLLQISVDPMHRLRESTRKDNDVWQRVRLCGNTAELVGRGGHACGSAPAPLAPGGAPLVFDATAPHVSERLTCPVDTPRPPRPAAPRATLP